MGLSHIVVVEAAPWAATGAGDVRAGDAGRRQAPHDLRCEARGGEFGVRVNMVNPDAVFDGSGLWSKEIRKARAKVYGVPVQQLENFCAGRNLLKVRVLDHWSCDPRRWGSAGSVPQMRDLRKIACGVRRVGCVKRQSRAASVAWGRGVRSEGASMACVESVVWKSRGSPGRY